MDWERQVNALFWVYGIVGALAGIVGAGIVVGIYQLVEAHSR